MSGYNRFDGLMTFRFGKLVSKYSISSQVQDSRLIYLCEAYEVLSSPFRRILYDHYGKEGINKGVQSNDLCIDPWIYHGNVLTTYSWEWH